MARTVIPSSGYGGQGLQVFTPIRIQTIAPGGTLTIPQSATQDLVVCIRVSTDTDYKINGTGDTASMPVGCTGIADGVTTLTFPSGALLEIM